MRVGVISGSLEAGGAQRVCLKMIEGLKEAGHQVALVTLTRTDWPALEDTLGPVVRPDKEIVVLKRDISGFAAYKPLFAALVMPSIRRRHHLDLLVNSQADTMPVKADILYVHYPTFSEFESVGINLKYQRSLFWRAYISLYKLLHGFFGNYLKSGILVTNSTYSKKALERHAKREPLVIYPPVEVGTFEKSAGEGRRKDLVVSVGRYSPEKSYENVLEVASRLRDVRFSIVGAMSGAKSSSYYQKLSSEVSEKKLSNVELQKALKFADLLMLYSKAKIYLHSMREEHFGITVVEAMAAGLVPVVYRGGGPWEDILRGKQGYFGYSYETPQEAAEIIQRLLSNEELRSEIAQHNRSYVQQFSDTNFKKQFVSIVNRLT